MRSCQNGHKIIKIQCPALYNQHIQNCRKDFSFTMFHAGCHFATKWTCILHDGLTVTRSSRGPCWSFAAVCAALAYLFLQHQVVCLLGPIPIWEAQDGTVFFRPWPQHFYQELYISCFIMFYLWISLGNWWQLKMLCVPGLAAPRGCIDPRRHFGAITCLLERMRVFQVVSDGIGCSASWTKNCSRSLPLQTTQLVLVSW